MTSVVSSLREAAEVLESMAIGAVNLASACSTESPYAGGTPEQQQLLVQQMQERKSYIYDAGQSVQIAEVFHKLADRAEADGVDHTPVDRGDLISDQAAEYSERLDRIQDFVLGFRNVPGAAQWFENVGEPILKITRGAKL
nr:hypothetical protein [Rhodococcus sp. 06-1059B-a]